MGQENDGDQEKGRGKGVYEERRVKVATTLAKLGLKKSLSYFATSEELESYITGNADEKLRLAGVWRERLNAHNKRSNERQKAARAEAKAEASA